MDPITGILAVAAMALASGVSEQAAAEQALEDETMALLGILKWHFAMSHDWNNFSLTVNAANLDAAWIAAEEDLGLEHDDLQEGDNGYRVYGIIKGGIAVNEHHTIPAGINAHFLWQGERDIEVATVSFSVDKTIKFATEVAIDRLGPDMRATLELHDYFSPDLIVIGGVVAHVGSL